MAGEEGGRTANGEVGWVLGKRRHGGTPPVRGVGASVLLECLGVLLAGVGVLEGGGEILEVC